MAVRANKNNPNAYDGSAYICEHMWANFFNIYGYIYVKAYIYVNIYRKQAGRRQVRSLLPVCHIDVFMFSCIGLPIRLYLSHYI